MQTCALILGVTVFERLTDLEAMIVSKVPIDLCEMLNWTCPAIIGMVFKGVSCLGIHCCSLLGLRGHGIAALACGYYL
jgi:hypothetical protein